MTSAYAPMGAMIASDRLAEPFLQGTDSFVHGFTFGGHPIGAAVALANIDVVRGRGDHRATSARTRRPSARCSTACATSRSSATCAAPATSTRSSSSRTARPRSLHARGVRDAAARLPLRRAVPARAHLPRRRPRRPGRPALPAADRRARRSSRRSSRSCGRCSRRRRSGCVHAEAERAARSMLTVRELTRRPRTSRCWPARRSRRAGALGAHLRAARPDAVAVRRRAAPDHGDGARERRGDQRAYVAAPGRPRARRRSASGPGFAHDERPGRDGRRRRPSAAFPLFEVPYATPFIAVTEKAFARLVNEQYAVLQRSIAAQERLQRIVLVRARARRDRRRARDARSAAPRWSSTAAARRSAQRAFRRELDDRGGRGAGRRAARPGAARRRPRLRARRTGELAGARARAARRRASASACRRPGWWP